MVGGDSYQENISVVIINRMINSVLFWAFPKSGHRQVFVNNKTDIFTCHSIVISTETSLFDLSLFSKSLPGGVYILLSGFVFQTDHKNFVWTSSFLKNFVDMITNYKSEKNRWTVNLWTFLIFWLNSGRPTNWARLLCWGEPYVYCDDTCVCGWRCSPLNT